MHYDSSDEEFMEKYNREASMEDPNTTRHNESMSEGEESSLNLNARLDALKRT